MNVRCCAYRAVRLTPICALLYNFVMLRLPFRGYTFKAGSYIYVNSPMISRSEWHPFSIIQVPGSPPRATFYAEAVSGKGKGER